MAFLYPFLNFLQAGVLWPPLAPFKPMLIASIVTGAVGLMRSKGDIATMRRGFFTHPIFRWLCIFMAIQVVSMYYSGLLYMLNEFNFWYVYVLFVVVSLLAIHDATSLYRYVWGMMLGSAFIIAYGLYAVAVHSPTLAGGRAGAYGMYENHNDYTFIIVMVLPFAYLLMRTCRTRLAKLVLFALVITCIVGTLLSLSRGGILALVLEIALLLWFTTAGTRRVLAIVAVALIGTAAVIHQFAAREENQLGHYSEADAESSRYELWRSARNMFETHPILGVGSRRFAEFSQDYGEISHDNRGKVAHNTYIEIAADTGLLGLTSFFLMLRGMFRATGRPRLAAEGDNEFTALRLAIAISLASIMVRSLLDAKVHDWSFYVLAVLAIATSTLEAKSVPADSAATPVPSPGPTLQPVRPTVYSRRL